MVNPATASFTVDAYSIAKIDTKFNDDGALEISWSCQAAAPDVEWVVVCTPDGNEKYAIRETTTDTSITLDNLFPDCTYIIEIKEADGEQVGGKNEATVTVPAGDSFTDYDFSTVYPVMYLRPEQEDWTVNNLATTRSSFTASERIAFACKANSLSLQSEDPVVVLLLVKNEAGKIVDYYSNAEDGGVAWKSMWNNFTYVGELTRTPSEPGVYTLELYFNNKRVRTTDDFTFTITE